MDVSTPQSPPSTSVGVDVEPAWPRTKEERCVRVGVKERETVSDGARDLLLIVFVKTSLDIQ